MKEILSIIGVSLTFIAYIPYIRDTLKGKTTPHVYTWLAWSLLSFIIFALQLSDHAGPGAYVTLASGIATTIIFLLGLRQGNKDITKTDTAIFIAVLVGTVLWLLADEPVLSTVLLVTTDVLAFGPTIRKSWNKPKQETPITYTITAFRHGLSVVALNKLTIVTALFPITWTIVNTLFVGMLIMRKKQLKQL